MLALAACSQPRQQPAPAPAQAEQLPPRQETEALIRRSAEEWAAVAVTGNPAPLARILADDYSGVSSDGQLRTKARQLAPPPPGPPPFTASKVETIDFRHFGPTVIAQGAETLTRRDGGPDARLIWTDVWMFRDGRWQVVASQDSVRPPAQQP
jgi:hypothetical protein